MAVSETSVLFAKDPSIADSDDWPVYSLREVNVLSGLTGETVSLFTANGDHPIRVIGYLEKIHKTLSKFVRDTSYETKLIEVTGICSYTFAESENGMSDFWVEGFAGWFLLKEPAPLYRETFSMMQECISMFNFMANKERMLRRKFKREGSNLDGDRGKGSYASSIFTSFLASRSNFRRRQNFDEVRVGYSSHREFMITSMLEGQGGLDWQTSPMLSYFKNESPDLFSEIRARVCDDEYARKPEAQGGKKGKERKVESKKAEGRNAEGKNEERNAESKKAEERNFESKKPEGRKVENEKAEGKVENEKAEGKVESKKAEERNVECKKPEGRIFERKKAEERRVEVKKWVRKVEEEKQAEETQLAPNPKPRMEDPNSRHSRKANQAETQLALNPKPRMEDPNSRHSRKANQAEETQLALNPKPRMEDPTSRHSRKAKRVIPTRGGLAMYPRYPSEDIRDEVNDRVRRREALAEFESINIAVPLSSEDELTGARGSPQNPSRRKLNLSKPRTPYTPTKSNLSEDELEQSKATKVGGSPTDQDVIMLDSDTSEGDDVVLLTTPSTLRPTRGTPRGRGASRPRIRSSTTRENPSTPGRTAGVDHGSFRANEDGNSTMPVTRPSRYETRAAQPMDSTPAPYHTYPPRRFLEVSVQRFELPDDRPQGPGNLWTCERPGCGYREHNAVSDEGLERVRSHIQHHADEDAKREPFFENPFRDDPNHPRHIPAWAYVIHWSPFHQVSSRADNLSGD
ncbi:hypothetical protein MMC31_006347 [Peltigera leucophlebia]|nr:hypothetical protein [Peltigera leucophlebia]